VTDDVNKLVEHFFLPYRLQKYRQGQVLILNGDSPGQIYYLLSGRVKVYDVSYRGDEIIINTFQPPAFFPMSLAINPGTSSFIYEAETDIEVRQAPIDVVLAFIQEHPEVTYDLLSRVYRGTDGLLGRMVYLMAGSAQSRLIFELTQEARRFGTMDGNQYSIGISEKDLGAKTGLSRETVNRELHKLKKQGFIEVHNKGLIIKDFSGLVSKLAAE